MIKAIYPGSFDPVTMGHLDIIERSSRMFDQVIVGVLNNTAKKPLFSIEERVIMLQNVVSHLENVTVESFDGLLVDFARIKGSNVIVRGLRALTDFDVEMQMAQSNRLVAPEVDTVFLSASTEYSFLSSSVVKEYARYGVTLEEFVPGSVIESLKKKIAVK